MFDVRLCVCLAALIGFEILILYLTCRGTATPAYIRHGMSHAQMLRIEVILEYGLKSFINELLVPLK